MNKIEHIGIAVKDIEKSNELFDTYLNYVKVLEKLILLIKNEPVYKKNSKVHSICYQVNAYQLAVFNNT